MTRRDLLLLAAKAYGVNFAYGLMEEMGMVVKPEPTDLDSLKGLLEARRRTGGRCVTIRHGDTVEETGLKQICEFEKGAYFNPGPTRIPHWHITIDYCRKFKVPLAPWININEGAYFYQSASPKLKGQRIRLRDAIADTTGYMAELVSRSVKADQADLVLSPDEKTQVLFYLTRYGFLDRDGKYRGSQRRSYKNFAGAGPGQSELEQPYALADLFESGLGGYFHFVNANDQQSTMLEVVGGVDKLARAFEANLRSPIHFGCQVADIKTSNNGVAVTYKDAHGHLSQIESDYCICTIPLPILKKIPHNFDVPVASAIKQMTYANSTKVATEYKRRFWEEDEHIFGGISWTDMPIGQVIYPCHEIFGKSGVLVNYTMGPSGSQLAALPVDKRKIAALEMNAKIHPQAVQEFKSSVTLSWANVPFSEGAFAVGDFIPGNEANYQLLCKPQGRLYFAGEHASRISAWMAGSIESARYVVKQIAMAAGKSTETKAPVAKLE